MLSSQKEVLIKLNPLLRCTLPASTVENKVEQEIQARGGILSLRLIMGPKRERPIRRRLERDEMRPEMEKF